MTITGTLSKIVNCYKLYQLPDARLDILSSDTEAYEPIGGMDINVDYRVNIDSSDSSQTPTTTLFFQIPVRSKIYKLMLQKIGSVAKSYLNGDYLVDYSTDDPQVDVPQVRPILKLVDAERGPCGELEYAMAYIPLNLEGQDPTTIITYDTLQEYTLSKRVYVPVNIEEQQYSLGDARLCPTSVRVVSPDVGMTQTGDIVSRYYEVEVEIPATVDKGISSVDWRGKGHIWQDIASSKKSIHTSETSYDWKKLIFREDDPANEDLAIPGQIRRQVKELVTLNLKMDSDDVKFFLSRLQTFLGQI